MGPNGASRVPGFSAKGGIRSLSGNIAGSGRCRRNGVAYLVRRVCDSRDVRVGWGEIVAVRRLRGNVQFSW